MPRVPGKVVQTFDLHRRKLGEGEIPGIRGDLEVSAEVGVVVAAGFAGAAASIIQPETHHGRERQPGGQGPFALLGRLPDRVAVTALVEQNPASVGPKQRLRLACPRGTVLPPRINGIADRRCRPAVGM